MWKRKWEECKKHMNELVANEQELSRKLSMSEHNLYSETEKVYDLQQLNQSLLFENTELKSQLLTFQS
jgi:predicted nuclease with TOPRIM domain